MHKSGERRGEREHELQRRGPVREYRGELTESWTDFVLLWTVSRGEDLRAVSRCDTRGASTIAFAEMLQTGDIFDKPRSGRPRKTTAREDRLLARKSKASPFSTAAELHETWSPEVPVSTRTVCRILSRNGLHGRISAQKPALNKRQLKNRVAFAKAHSLLKGWMLEKWQKVDFSDESSVELHHSCRKYCRRPTGARMDPRFTQKSVKFGGGKIMVWGYIHLGSPIARCLQELRKPFPFDQCLAQIKIRGPINRSVSVSGLSLPHCIEMSRTTDPVGHWEDLEAWLSAMTDSLLPKAAETLRHQTQDQLDDNLTSIMKHDPCQSYSHEELAKISSSLSHTLIATLKLSDRHAANLQKELTHAQQRIKQLEMEAQERQKGSDETDASAKKEIARLQEALTTTTQEREHTQSAYAELTSKLQYAEQLLE
ncbi:hypothetical protein QQF64_031187 [Cirrhinus molitorella]|uniref:Transposase Tc1-like domain-containing protein n=1 Tax=Cirrhinus molitorella TaxID=172907 RepID=A0ABR3N5L5_9TELE